MPPPRPCALPRFYPFPTCQARPCNWTFLVTCTGFESMTHVSSTGVVEVTTGTTSASEINMAGQNRSTTCTVILTVTDIYGATAYATRFNLFTVRDSQRAKEAAWDEAACANDTSRQERCTRPQLNKCHAMRKARL